MTAKNLREMLTAIKFQKPPDNISSTLLFQKLNSRLKELINQVPKELLGKPLFFGELNKNQWEKLDQLQGDLNEEYNIRREMLLKRLDVTVNSFLVKLFIYNKFKFYKFYFEFLINFLCSVVRENKTKRK